MSTIRSELLDGSISGRSPPIAELGPAPRLEPVIDKEHAVLRCERVALATPSARERRHLHRVRAMRRVPSALLRRARRAGNGRASPEGAVLDSRVSSAVEFSSKAAELICAVLQGVFILERQGNGQPLVSVAFPPLCDTADRGSARATCRSTKGCARRRASRVARSAASSSRSRFSSRRRQRTPLDARTLSSAWVAQVKNSRCSWDRPHALPPGPYRLPWRLTFAPGPPPMPKV